MTYCSIAQSIGIENTLQWVMSLASRFQFALAPLVIVVLLARLVAYTLLVLSNIHRENEVTVKWELLADRIQVAIATVTLTNKLVVNIVTNPLTNDDDRLFDYLEQTRILARRGHARRGQVACFTFPSKLGI